MYRFPHNWKLIELYKAATGQSQPTTKPANIARQQRARKQEPKSKLKHLVEQVGEGFDKLLEYAQSLEQTALDVRAQNEKLNKANSEQIQEIANLKTTISQLQAQTSSAMTIKHTEIDMGQFIEIPRDYPNGGMLREKNTRQVEVNGKSYEKRFFFFECKLDFPGQRTGDTIEHNGTSFTQIMKGNVEQLIQNFEPGSVVQVDGKYFLKWVTLKETHDYGI